MKDIKVEYNINGPAIDAPPSSLVIWVKPDGSIYFRGEDHEIRRLFDACRQSGLHLQTFFKSMCG